MTSSRRRLAVAGLAVLLVTGLSSCLALPRGGEVHAAPSSGHEEADSAPYFAPPPPRPGGSPAQIASGFLDAMTANPLSTSVAQQYLTTQARTRWRPERETIVYEAAPLVTHGNRMALRLGRADRLDSRGAWLGRPDHPDGPWPLRLVKEKGQWRISNPPDALVIPQNYFENRFYQASLYFFDETAQVLVPEPVYVPLGPQAATTLVRGLLAGPGDAREGVSRTFFPAETAVDLSVPVTDSGTAEVPLSSEVLDLSSQDLERMSVQLSWTLRQVLGVQRIRVTVDGAPLSLPNGNDEIPVDSGAEYDPSVIWATRDLFGLHDGRLVRVSGGGAEERAAGPYGSQQRAPRSFAVNLAGEEIAAVGQDGATVTTSPIRGTSPPAQTRTVFEGTDVLRPAFDFQGDLWLVDRTREGAVVWVRRPGTLTRVEVPDVSGHAISDFTVSRDGSRLVASVIGEDRDVLRVARIRRYPDGTVHSVSAARAIPLVATPGAVEERVRDLGWRTPTSLAVLIGSPDRATAVVVESIDGSPGLGDLASTPQQFRADAENVVTEPSSGSPLYVATAGGPVFQLTSAGRWTATGVAAGLRDVGYAG